MNTPSSFTVAGTSDIADRLRSALRESYGLQDDGRIERVGRLCVRIKHLEAKGLLKRQRYASPSTGDFERMLFCKEAR